MRKIISAFALTATLAVALFAMSSGGIATAGSGSGNGATVVKDISGCSMISVPGVIAFTTDQSMAVDSASGNVTLRCTFRPEDIVSGAPPAKTVKVPSVGCGTPFGFTLDATAMMNPHGNGLLVCQIKANQ